MQSSQENTCAAVLFLIKLETGGTIPTSNCWYTCILHLSILLFSLLLFRVEYALFIICPVREKRENYMWKFKVQRFKIYRIWKKQKTISLAKDLSKNQFSLIDFFCCEQDTLKNLKTLFWENFIDKTIQLNNLFCSGKYH